MARQITESWTIASPEGMARCTECHRNLEVGARVTIADHRHDVPYCSPSCATADSRPATFAQSLVVEPVEGFRPRHTS